MKQRQIALLWANIGLLIELLREVSMHKEAVATHTETVKLAQKRMEKYNTQFRDTEYMKTLSPAEQQCLNENAQNTYMTIQSLQKELDYLDMTKQNQFVINAANNLDDAYLLMEYHLDVVGRTGETIVPHLSCIKPKTFTGGKYDIQIQSFYSELEALTYDFRADIIESSPLDIPTLLGISPVLEHLSLATMWIKREKERIAQEPKQEIRKIVLPEETTPKVPAGPEPTEEVVTN